MTQTFGDRLYQEGFIPPQLEQDANLIEDIFPKQIADDIDAIQDDIDLWQSNHSHYKRQKTQKRPSPNVIMPYAKRPPRQYKSTKSINTLSKRVSKLECCNNTEVNHYDIAQGTNVLNAGISTFSLLNGLTIGNTNVTRTGTKIKVVRIKLELSSLDGDGGARALGGWWFLIRPRNENQAPENTHFQRSGRTVMYNPTEGWEVWKKSTDELIGYNGLIRLSMPMRSMNVHYEATTNQALKNNLFLVYCNCSDQPEGGGHDISFSSRVLFRG